LKILTGQAHLACQFTQSVTAVSVNEPINKQIQKHFDEIPIYSIGRNVTHNDNSV